MVFDWKEMYNIWREKINNSQIQLQPFFSEIKIHDPGMPSREELQFTWLEAGKIREEQLQLQRFFEGRPGVVGLHHYDHLSRGEMATLYYLWDYREDIEKIAAIFISAILFPLAEKGDMKRIYPEYLAKPAYNAALEAWVEEKTPQYPWHYKCNSLLPNVISQEWEQRMDLRIYSPQELITSTIADDHITLLQEYRPVVISFAPERDPLINKQLYSIK